MTFSRRIFLALGSLLVAMLLAFAAFSLFGLHSGLGPYVAEIELRRMDWLAQMLQRHYATRGSWRELMDNEPAWQRLQAGLPGLSDLDPFAANDARGSDAARRLPSWYAGRLLPARPMELLPPRSGLPDARDLADSVYQRLTLVDAGGHRVIGAPLAPGDDGAARLALHHGQRVVGWLVLAPLRGLGDEVDRAFLARQSGFVGLIGIVGLLMALGLSWVLARRWLRPIEGLAAGAQDIAGGRLSTRVPVQGRDEIALLCASFNTMAERLDGIEASRRAWLTDVAHELRTPLAAMRAEIEAVQDGVRPFEPASAERLHRQVMRLGRLVDDLRASMQEPPPVAPDVQPAPPADAAALLLEAIDGMRLRFAQRRILIDDRQLRALPPASAFVPVHADRLHQLFGNLLENAWRYTDPGGQLRVAAALRGDRQQRWLELVLEDSAPGARPHELPRLFERFYRGESSRNRATGGSGLGLAICRELVQAHGGRITAEASELGGLRLRIRLPSIGAPAACLPAPSRPPAAHPA